MIKVVFFAQVKELIGQDFIELSGNFTDAEQIRIHLSEKGEKWARALETGKLLVAINQTISPMHASVQSGDEVAFFPPVTGG